jgi:hypothetical protein
VVGIRLMEAEGRRTMAGERRDSGRYISTWTAREEDKLECTPKKGAKCGTSLT